MESNLLQNAKKCAIVIPDDVRQELERIERQLIPLLNSVQKILGKEPSVVTREQRRHSSHN